MYILACVSGYIYCTYTCNFITITPVSVAIILCTPRAIGTCTCKFTFQLFLVFVAVLYSCLLLVCYIHMKFHVGVKKKFPFLSVPLLPVLNWNGYSVPFVPVSNVKKRMFRSYLYRFASKLAM